MSNGSSHFSPSSFPMSLLFLYILLRVLDVVNTLHVLKRLRKQHRYTEDRELSTCLPVMDTKMQKNRWDS